MRMFMVMLKLKASIFVVVMKTKMKVTVLKSMEVMSAMHVIDIVRRWLCVRLIALMRRFDEGMLRDPRS